MAGWTEGTTDEGQREWESDVWNGRGTVYLTVTEGSDSDGMSYFAEWYLSMGGSGERDEDGDLGEYLTLDEAKDALGASAADPYDSF